MASFHSNDGWHWARLADGTVQVSHGGHIETEIAPSVWCSVVASMSLEGENLQTFEAMQRFHTGTVSRDDPENSTEGERLK